LINQNSSLHNQQNNFTLVFIFERAMEPILNIHPNFRDLGGIHTKSGKKVKQNRAFRSGFLGELNGNDLAKLVDLNISEILDLRTKEEIDLTGKGNYPESIVYQNIALNTGNISKLLFPIFQKGEFHLLDPHLLNNVYLDLITKFNDELATIFRTILNSDKGIVFHCSHGKDRTGVISALLLDFFEVDRAHIYEDYLMSNELLKASNEYQIQRIKDNFTALFKREVTEEEFTPVKFLFFCQADLLKSVFSYLDNEYGSVANYFQSELKLTAEELELLKSNYLE
jgi:protein-tyrosine phosphatase